MVAGEALQAAELTGIEAMGQKAEKDAEQRAAAAAAAGGAEGVSGGTENGAQGQKRKFVAASTTTANKVMTLEKGRTLVSEEIDIDDEGPVQLRAVPLAVFGAAAVSAAVENGA